MFPLQGAWVRSQVGEQRSLALCQKKINRVGFSIPCNKKSSNWYTWNKNRIFGHLRADERKKHFGCQSTQINANPLAVSVPAKQNKALPSLPHHPTFPKYNKTFLPKILRILWASNMDTCHSFKFHWLIVDFAWMIQRLIWSSWEILDS